MQTKSRAIVLRTLKLGDEKIIVDCLTQEQGRLAFVCRIPKTPKARVKLQYFQPLSVLALEFDYRERQQLQHFRDIRLALPYASIPFDTAKLTISLFLAEFLYYGTRTEQHNSNLFDFVERSLAWLDGASGSCANFHLVFMMRFAAYVGFMPNVENYRPGCFFDLREGCFVDHAPLHADFLSAEEAPHVAKLARLSYDTMHLYAMTRQERNHCTEVLLKYYRLHIPGFPEMKSLVVLRELFN